MGTIIYLRVQPTDSCLLYKTRSKAVGNTSTFVVVHDHSVVDSCSLLIFHSEKKSVLLELQEREEIHSGFRSFRLTVIASFH